MHCYILYIMIMAALNINALNFMSNICTIRRLILVTLVRLFLTIEVVNYVFAHLYENIKNYQKVTNNNLYF